MMLRAYVIVFLLFLYAPILLLPVFAFNSGTVIAFPLDGFTFHWFAELAVTKALHEAVVNSLIIAAVTAVISTALGVAAARSAVRYRFPGKAAALGLIMVPLVLTEIIVAVSLLVVVVQIMG